MPIRIITSPLAALACALCLAPADARAGGAATPAPIAEIVTFRLMPGIAVADFLAAARATEAAVAAQPGFLRRSLSQDDAGLWTDYVEWADLPAAQAAADVVVTLPDFAAFGAAIDPTGMAIRHARIAWSMGD